MDETDKLTKMVFYKLFKLSTIVLCLLALNLFPCSLAQDVLGCGGFVKSDLPIDFSRIEVKLYTKQGVLKYHTDCAPNNGYYLIPVYDKGDYVLKVEPPKGWLFEPDSVPLQIDGHSDVCSPSKDINFHFKGFSVYGQVISRGSDIGPPGIPVQLSLSSNSEGPLQTAETGQNGDFSFSVVLPNTYVVRATSDSWRYDVGSLTISVTTDNGYLKEKLVVSGYEVSGQVVGDGDEPITGVSFILFGQSGGSSKKPRGCESHLPAGIDSSIVAKQKPRVPLCHVTSSAKGRFAYPLVVPGHYVVVPFYQGQSIKFDVSPASLEFEVQHESLVLKQSFKVDGFSVSGRVARSTGGEGVVGAAVLLDGKKIASTEANGIFHLENIKAGSYKIQVIAEKMQFSPSVMKITPNAGNLPELVASSFEVCGVLRGDMSSIGINPLTVFFTDDSSGGTRMETDTNTLGQFCIWLPPGNYIARVEEYSGSTKFIFKPASVQVKVRDSAVSDIEFVQFKAKVGGSVSCLENCDGNVHLSLRSMDSASQPSTSHSVVKNSVFEFDDVLPGKYELSLEFKSWCWQETTRTVIVDDQDVNGLLFRQKGYLLTVIASHQTVLNYQVNDMEVQESNKSTGKHKTSKKSIVTNDVKSGELSIAKGDNQFCLEWPGKYELHSVGCHIFSNDVFVYDTSSPSVVLLDATRHLLSGTVVSAVRSADVKIAVRVIEEGNIVTNGEEAVLGPLTAKQREKQGDYEYLFTYWAVPNKILELSPQSLEILFYPDKHRITTVDDCMQYTVEFSARKGLFIEGGITPALGGAKITVVAKDGSMKPIVLETSANGRYRVGPLHSYTDYEVHAEKQGHVLTRSAADAYSFESFKLAEIVVSVVDDKTNVPLAGVLVSLSGHSDYRRNSLTRKDGKMVFSELGPGQYYLRAMMKEFQFDPSSQMVEVKEGATVTVALRGKRIAFSCYGRVLSLTGAPEGGIIMEAVGVDHCKGTQEEVKTDVDGTFRLRGLKPNCSYDVRLKNSTDVNGHIERASPESRRIQITNKDVNQVSFTAFRPVLWMDVTGTVVTMKEHWNYLKVRLSNDDGMEQTYPLAQSSFFQFLMLPMDRRLYTLSLETSLSRVSFDIPSLPEVVFLANETHRHFSMAFRPKPRNSDSDLVHGSYFVLPVALLLLAAMYRYSKVQPLLSTLLDVLRHFGNSILKFRNNVAFTRSNSSSSGGASLFSSFLPNLVDATSMKKKVKPRKAQ